MIVNLDDVKSNGYIDKEGSYTLKVESFEKITTDKGNECHKYKCVSEDGESIFVSLYLTENAMWKYKAFLKALGHSGSGSVDLDQLPNIIVGKKFIGIVKKQPPKVNIVTGETEESKYYEVAKFSKC